MKRKGFTLIELLVVIAVIALLLSIMVPALRLARDQAMVAVCSNQIRQQLLGFTMYAGEYNNKIFGDFGWIDGTDRWKFRLMMNLMGMSTEGSIVEQNQLGGALVNQKDIAAPKVFYCPSNIASKGDKRQMWWDFDIGSGSRYGFRVIGYQWILDEDPDPITGAWAHKARDRRYTWARNGQTFPTMIEDNKIFPTRLDIKQSAEVELVTDLARTDAGRGWFSSMETSSSGGGGPGINESSSHVKNTYALYGANIGFCDGHVAWRPFSELKIRWQWTSGPYWWW